MADLQSGVEPRKTRGKSGIRERCTRRCTKRARRPCPRSGGRGMVEPASCGPGRHPRDGAGERLSRDGAPRHCCGPPVPTGRRKCRRFVPALCQFVRADSPFRARHSRLVRAIPVSCAPVSIRHFFASGCLQTGPGQCMLFDLRTPRHPFSPCQFIVPIERIPHMSSSLKALSVGLLAFASMLAAPSAANASNLTYTATGGLITGTLNGTPFTDATWSITGTADPTNVVSGTYYYGAIPGNFLAMTPMLTIGTGSSTLQATLVTSDKATPLL
jgi:hypothetical protein